MSLSIVASILFCVAPVIRNGQMEFASGTTRPYLTSPRALRSPDEAQERGLPVSVRHDVRVVQEWCRVLKTIVETGYEDEVSTIEFFDFSGRLVGKSPRFYGRAHLLQQAKRVVLDGETSHFLNYDTFLLDTNGRVVRKIVRPTTSLLAVGHSEDQRLIWVASNRVKKGRAYADVQVITRDGARVARRTLDAAGRITLTHDKRKYVLAIPSPKLPE
jgi:hypothetical protein